MADFTNMNREQIKAILDGFKQRANEFLSNLETLMEIYGENTITRDILDDALAVRKGETTMGKIQALHKGRKIGTKSKMVLEPPMDVLTTLLSESEEILMVGGITPYKFAESIKFPEISDEEFRIYQHVGVIPAEREGIGIYRGGAKIPLEYFAT